MKFSKPNNNAFFTGLKSSINNYFSSRTISRKGNLVLLWKGLLLLSLFLFSYLSLFRENATTLSQAAAYIVMGLTGVMIVFNLVHDASHRAVSRYPWVNRAITYLGDLVGINTYIWDIRHNIQHHSFTNVLGGDLIIENIPLIRLSPHQPFRSFHRYQIYYAPLMYMFYSFYWMFVIDFRLFFRKDICNLHQIKHPKREWLILIFSKLFYVFYMLFLPWYFTSLGLVEVIGLFMLMHMAAGLLLSFVAVLGHFVEGPSFPDAAGGIIDNSWSEHELEATIDFAPRSKIVNWITGGLNTHVAHHLFPTVCHVHYYEMTRIIESYCKTHGYPYQSESLAGGLSSHFRYLRKLSKPSI